MIVMTFGTIRARSHLRSMACSAALERGQQHVLGIAAGVCRMTLSTIEHPVPFVAEDTVLQPSGFDSRRLVLRQIPGTARRRFFMAIPAAVGTVEDHALGGPQLFVD